MRPKFKIWDKKMELWYMPTYRAYAGVLHELFLAPSGDLIKKTIDGVSHESTFPDRYEVVLYTGHKDEKGIDIYEGDIVEKLYHSGTVIYRVTWDDWGWSLTPKKDYHTIKSGSGCLEGCKIVGNIRENSGLLKGA